MKKSIFIFTISFFQACFAGENGDFFLSSSESSLLLAKEENWEIIKDNINNFAMPLYREDSGNGHCIFSKENDVIFYFFNTGQGNCTLVKQGEKALLIDVGGTNIENFNKVFMQCLGEALIESVIITHPHVDHYNFLQKIPEKCFSKDVFLVIGGPTKWEENTKGVKIIKTLEDVIGTFKLKFSEKYYICPINKISISNIEFKLNNLLKKVEFNFLSFEHNLLNENNLNSYSLVFKIKYKNNGILFTGDSTGDALDRFLTQNKNDNTKKNKEILHNVNVFVMPHHGSNSDDSWRWTNRIIKYNYSNLVSVITCVDPSTSCYGHARNWIRDLIFPPYARTDKEHNPIIYSVKTGLKEYTKYIKKTKNRLYETGLFTYGITVVFSESGNIHISNSDQDTFLTHLPYCKN